MGRNVDQELSRIADLLGAHGAKLEPGLSQQELDAIERAHGIRFPPDLERMLRAFHPQGERFPNWREVDRPSLKESLERPVQGVVFDIENNAYWHRDWGAKPDSTSEAIEVGLRRLATVPKLVPLYAHRYLPTTPLLEGNPVLSVYQTDVIVYGVDLADYFENEFGAGRDLRAIDMTMTTWIPFWNDLVFFRSD